MGRLLQKFITGVTPIGETPAGTVNGTNTTFTLTYTPSSVDNVIVTLNGIPQIPSTDFSISGVTITFTTAPVASQTVFVFYTK